MERSYSLTELALSCNFHYFPGSVETAHFSISAIYKECLKGFRLNRIGFWNQTEIFPATIMINTHGTLETWLFSNKLTVQGLMLVKSFPVILYTDPGYSLISAAPHPIVEVCSSLGLSTTAFWMCCTTFSFVGSRWGRGEGGGQLTIHTFEIGEKMATAHFINTDREQSHGMGTDLWIRWPACHLMDPAPAH